MKRLKKAVNWIPVGVLMTIAILSFQKWQTFQASTPDYNNPNHASQGLAPKPGLSEMWEVVNVVDGETLTVKTEGKKDLIRLCGINAPELGQPVGNDAREKLRLLVSAAGSQVIVVPSERNRDGQLLADIFVSAGKGTEEEKLLNYEMVQAGMARHYKEYSDRCPNGSEILADAEKEAKSKQVGLWSLSNE
ncbi:thermonuclease family protein [Leptolyngbyaceae cyanobacterium UHCC 1019]